MNSKKLNVKQIKQMCSVPGCTARGSYTIARTRYFGGVNVCENCLREAMEVIAPVTPPEPPTLEELLHDDVFKEQLRKAIEDGVKEGLELAKKEQNALDDTSGSDTENPIVNDSVEEPAENQSEPENTSGEETPPEQTDPVEKRFVCEKCGKTYASKSGLTNHEKACDVK